MGYELHITRKDDWADEEADGFSLEEWLSYVMKDSELKLNETHELRIGNEISFQDRPGNCEWNAHPKDEWTWFSYWQGDIFTKNPDTPTIRKMMQIAANMNAKVMGDDGEIYTEEYLAALEQEKIRAMPSEKQVTKPWWRFW